MNCPNCGFLLPDDSKFCQYCGTVLSGGVPENEPVHTSAGPRAVPSDTVRNAPAAMPDTGDPGSAARQAHKGKKTKQCKACGADIDPDTKKCTVCGKPASRVQPAVLALAAVSAALVCSLVINFLQYGSAAKVQQELEQQMKNSNATITAQESAILELEDQLEEAEEERQRSKALLLSAETRLEQAQKGTHYFDLIRSFLKNFDAGYASDQFFANKSVLILSLADGPQTFSLTTGFSGGGEISFNTTGNSALVSFTEDSWYDHTTIRVSPKSTGATCITFSNTLNSQTFRVLVIVA